MYRVREYQANSSLPGVYYTTRNNNANNQRNPTNIVGLPTFVSITKNIKPLIISDRWDIQGFVKQYHPRNAAQWINTCETILNNGSMIMALPLSPSNGSTNISKYGALYADTSYFSAEITTENPETVISSGNDVGVDKLNTRGKHISWWFAGSDLSIKPVSKHEWELSFKPFNAETQVQHKFNVSDSNDTGEYEVSFTYDSIPLKCKIKKYANISENVEFKTTIIGGALPSTKETLGKHTNSIGTLDYKGASSEKTSYVLELSKNKDNKNLVVKLYQQDNSLSKHTPNITEICSNTLTGLNHKWKDLCPFLDNTFIPAKPDDVISEKLHFRKFVFNSNNTLTSIENYAESILRSLGSTGMYIPCVYIPNWTTWNIDVADITKSFVPHFTTKYGLTTILIDEDADKDNIRKDKKSVAHPKIHVLKSGDSNHSLEIGAAVASKISSRSCDSITAQPIILHFDYNFNYNDDEVENYFKQGVICLHQMPYQTNPVIYSDVTSYTGGDEHPEVYKHGYAIRIINSIVATLSRTYIQKYMGKLRGNQLETLKHEFITILTQYVNELKIDQSALRNIELEMDNESKLHVILNIQIIGYIDTLVLEVAI